MDELHRIPSKSVNGPKQLLASGDLEREYGLGRDLRLALMKRLPHVQVGRAGGAPKLMVHRTDLEALLERARREGADLWELVRRYDDLSIYLENKTPVGAGVV